MFESVRPARLAWRQALGVFLLGVSLTGVATWVTGRFADDAEARSLDINSLRLSNDLQSLIQGHATLLSALRSLDRVNAPLTRAQFHTFVAGGRLLEQHPGARALEFARRVDAADVPAYEQALQRDVTLAAAGYPTIRVGPASGADDRWIVEYIEPIAGNEAAFGFDLGAEASRRAAIEAACAGDRPASTAPVRLVQEEGASLGLVVFSPVYDVDPAPQSGVERLRRCSGLMIVVYRVADMLAKTRADNPTIDFEIYDAGPTATRHDAAVPRPEGLLFDTDEADGGLAGSGRRMELDFRGRRWLILIADRVTSTVSVRGAVPVAGVLFSAVVAALVLQLATVRRRAQARGRLVAAGDRDRRSLERDLHDGAQQRLLSVSLAISQAQAQVGDDRRAAALLQSASEELGRSLIELRELAQGLHPAVLSDHGLAVAAESVVARAPVPVDLRVDLDGRLPLGVEVAAYYVLCEAMANAAKHAQATRMSVSIWQTARRLIVEVRDDGVGLAKVTGGSGLRGLADRVEALDGQLRVTGAPGNGTCVRAELPFA